MSEPGTYTGSDGQEYRWVKYGNGYTLGYPNNEAAYALIALADWPAAKAALDALILSEKVELEKQEAQASETLRDACLELREMASRRGLVCGPCEECKLQPYWGKGVDALIAAEKEVEQWVELNPNYRITRDGARAQGRRLKDQGNFYKGWHNIGLNRAMPSAYRAGLRVKQEQARALAEEVLAWLDDTKPWSWKAQELYALARDLLAGGEK